MLKLKCEKCNKSIKNFTKHEDWPNRKYHLKCWNEIQNDNYIAKLYKKYTGKTLKN